jgi:hypothetical protein
VAFFESAEQAWHDAYSTIKRSSSDMGHIGGGNLDGYKTYVAELSKITSAVQKLPEGFRHLGMVLFAPEPSQKNIEYVNQYLWKQYSVFRKDRLGSLKQAERMATLVTLVVKEAQIRVCSKSPNGLTHAQVGQCLNLSNVQQYNRDWRPDFELLTKALLNNGYKALEPITEAVNRVNKNYQVEQRRVV